MIDLIDVFPEPLLPINKTWPKGQKDKTVAEVVKQPSSSSFCPFEQTIFCFIF